MSDYSEFIYDFPIMIDQKRKHEGDEGLNYQGHKKSKVCTSLNFSILFAANSSFLVNYYAFYFPVFFSFHSPRLVNVCLLTLQHKSSRLDELGAMRVAG